MKRLYILCAVALLLLGVTSSAGVIQIPSAEASGIALAIASGSTPVVGDSSMTPYEVEFGHSNTTSTTYAFALYDSAGDLVAYTGSTTINTASYTHTVQFISASALTASSTYYLAVRTSSEYAYTYRSDAEDWLSQGDSAETHPTFDSDLPALPGEIYYTFYANVKNENGDTLLGETVTADFERTNLLNSNSAVRMWWSSDGYTAVAP